MKKFMSLIIIAMTLLLGISSAALANPVLMTELPWNYNDSLNMSDVFGSNFIEYTTYRSAYLPLPGDIFNSANRFVMMEGGAATATNWYNYLTANQTQILNWVNGGGSLLLMSGGWNFGTYTFGPAYITANLLSYSGTLTAAGVNAFTFQSTPATHSGTYYTQSGTQHQNAIALGAIPGNGLTIFMTSPTYGPIVAGTPCGNGYIMYAGLVTSNFDVSGPSLVNDVIAFTAAQADHVPLPGSMLLFGSGLLGLAGWRRFRKS
jgi:PEP-CTERM motif